MSQTKFAKTVAVLLAGAGAANAVPNNMKLMARAPPTALPENAAEFAIKFQPVLDYDMDSCYNVAAIGSDGTISAGLDPTGGIVEDCREPGDLDNQNVYARSRCNNGYCAFMYEHYFEKDQSGASSGGHRHDWENIVVIVQDGSEMPAYVAVSAHDGYTTRPASEIMFEGTHPKVVYHKDGDRTHAFRFAKNGDEPPENARSEWIRGPLVDYDGFGSADLRQKLYGAFPVGGIGVASCKLADQPFIDFLKTAIGKQVPAFDTALDA